ncbi:PAS-domain containing protein [Roseivivax marinus]|uniref:PAS-domain containing protein n=1 Tax=Roseivivax marinus TaxID=1379903 RepID=UPI001F039F3B|nr:PAS-domain containing protein [Roseivivax marinus]UMA64601.1 PAS-domain containing protein [Roseivivax marinus]
MGTEALAAALIGGTIGLAGLVIFLWRSPGVPAIVRQAAPRGVPLFLFRDGRCVDASSSGHTILDALEAPLGADGAGATWSDVARILSRVFPDLPSDSPPTPGAVAAPGVDTGLRLEITEAGKGVHVAVFADAGDAAALLAGALAAEEVRILRAGIDTAPHPAWSEDDARRIVWANAAFRDLCRETGSDRPFEVCPDSAAERQTTRAQIGPDGPHAPRWFEIISFRLEDGWAHHAISIDAVVRAEAAQRNFVQTLSLTFSFLPTGLAIFDRTQALVLFNPALCDLTGLTAEQLANRPDLMSFFDLLRERQIMPEPRDYASWRADLARLIAAARDEGYSDTWSLPSGLTYRVNGRPHPDGAVAFLIEDISDEVSLTRRFRRELELSQSVIDAFDDAVAVFTAGGLLAFCNAAYRRLWNTDPDTTVETTSVIEATRHWQSESAPSPIWGDLRDFVRQHGERAGWDAQVGHRSGETLICRAEPIHGGATLVRFSNLAAESDRLSRRA